MQCKIKSLKANTPLKSETGFQMIQHNMQKMQILLKSIKHQNMHTVCIA